MTNPRHTLVSLEDTNWYHCVARCVRRAFLCGYDAHSGKDFEHRRGWLRERMLQLADIFALDVAAYAVMSNHFHVVVHIDRERAMQWSADEVLRRWLRLFKGPALVSRFMAGEPLDDAELAAVDNIVSTYRGRLHDLSWFMRTLNEHIARMANAEDGVSGRFWEGRFKSQALLDDQALLAAMAYVDLNPVRAGIADTPETSEFTSIQQRIEGFPSTAEPPLHNTKSSIDSKPETPPLAPLMPFDATARTGWAIPFAFEDYLELLDWTGRAVHPHKRGFIAENRPKILDRLGFDGETFAAYASRMLQEFGSVVGAPPAISRYCARRQSKYVRGVGLARKLFAAARAAEAFG